MAGSVLFEELVEVPLGIASLADFREWCHSDSFPENGRIDYIAGRIEVDMAPENIGFHGAPKGDIFGELLLLLRETNIGRVFTDSTRIASPAGDVSAEPDIVLVTHQSLRNKDVRLVPTKDAKEGSYIEFEGAVDLVVEVISPSSVKKDTERLFDAFQKAGVREYWIVDARQTSSRFLLYQNGPDGFVLSEPDEQGFRSSIVLGRHVRLDRTNDEHGLPVHRLICRAE